MALSQEAEAVVRVGRTKRFWTGLLTALFSLLIIIPTTMVVSKAIKEKDEKTIQTGELIKHIAGQSYLVVRRKPHFVFVEESTGNYLHLIGHYDWENHFDRFDRIRFVPRNNEGPHDPFNPFEYLSPNRICYGDKVQKTQTPTPRPTPQPSNYQMTLASWGGS